MREIKFRAWDKKQKFMEVNGIMLSYLEGGLKCDGPCYYLSNGWVEGNINRDCSGMKDIEADVILMQSTGLKDKNGKEAYHKDIVEYYDEKWIMEWNENSACFELLSIDGSEVTGMDYSMKFEIIGNILRKPRVT